MNKQVRAGWVLILVVAGLGSAQASTQATDWASKMRELEQVLQDLMIDTASDARFLDPKNRSRIEKNASRLSRLSHELTDAKKMTSPDGDPSLTIISGIFASESKHAAEMLKTGHREYARNVLRASTAYCVACHTRSSSGPNFKLEAKPESLKALKSAMDRASYLASVRQFDAAVAEFGQILADPAIARDRPIEWERALRSTLGIHIRVKADPAAALAALNNALAQEGIPFYLKANAQQWRTSLEDWKKEPTRTTTSEEGLFREAVRLMAKAKESQKFPADRSADMIYLRASAAVHDYLTAHPKGKHTPEALYLAGIAYEVLQGLTLWDLHEFYFQACIRQAPHTEVARGCYQHLEQSIYDGFTGSAGTAVPAGLRKKLKELEALASPEVVIQKLE